MNRQAVIFTGKTLILKTGKTPLFGISNSSHLYSALS